MGTISGVDQAFVRCSAMKKREEIKIATGVP